METPDLYLAIRASSLQLVLALASGTFPKVDPKDWQPAPSTAATVPAKRS